MQRTPRFWSSKLLGERWWYRAWNGGRAGLDHGGGAGLDQDEEGGWAWSALDWGGVCGEPPIPAPAPRPSWRTETIPLSNLLGKETLNPEANLVAV